MRALLLALVAVFALAGCGGPVAPPLASAQGPDPAPGAVPQNLSYPGIGVDAPLSPTGLTDDGELAVPPLDRPEEIVYANWSPELAETMPTVLASHVNGRNAAGSAIPGGFARLAEATPGDELTVTGVDGTRTRYRISGVDTIDKDEFPTDRVFADGPPGRLVLITCGGDIDHAARSYESNVIVSAEAVPQ